MLKYKPNKESIASYNGWLVHANCINLQRKLLTMDTENKLTLKRLFRDNPELATSIHKGGNVDADFESLSNLSKIPLDFLLMHKGYIKQMVFTI